MAYKKILFRRDSAASWTAENPTLSTGEVGLETDSGKIKIGNGSTAWNSLSYFVGNLPGATLDALGDVIITSAANGDFLRWNGTAWINDAVNLSTDTVGNYVESLVAGTGVTLTNNSGEAATPTVAIGQAVGTSSSVTFANVTSSLTGNASTASALQTARSISLGGDLSGSASFDGSQNINITATVQPNSVALGTDTTGNYMSDLTQGTGVTITHTPGEGSNATIAIGQAVATSSSVTFAHVLGDVTGNLTGNSSTATALQTPRTISLSGDVSGSVSFNGTSNAEITTTIQPNSIALGTDTSGNYMSSVVAGTGVQVSHTPGEGSEATISIGQDVGTGQSVTFAGATIDAIKIGVTNANTIDTTSGNLTIDSSGGTVTIADNLIVDGTLTVSGSVAYVNTTNLQVGDNIITLNHDETGVPSENAGIEIERGTSANVFLRYNETSDKWELTNDGSVYSTIETASTVGTSLKQQLWLNTVYAATTGILPNSPSYTAGTTDLNGGTGIGAKLAGTTNGTLEVDGAPVPLENRILVKNQANALHNGIYKVTATGSASATWELTRASDFDNSTSGQTIYGKSVRIATGTVNALQVFAVISAGSLSLNGLEGMIHVIGTDSITWTQVSGKATLIPGNGLQITNNELSLPTISQSNTASTSGATNFIKSINVDSYGRLLGVTTNDVLLGLGTNTMGDYVQSISASAGTGITVSGTGEGAVVSVGSNATPNNTTSAIVMRDGSGNFSAGTITAELSGNASTANALYTSKSIGLTGDLSGSVSFNGSQDVVINAAIQANSVALGTDTTGNYVNDVTAGTGISVTHTPGEGSSATVAINATLDNLSDVTVPSPTSGDFLKWNGTAWVNDPINLGTDTAGNYMSDLTQGTGVTITHTPGEASNATIAIGQAVATSSSVQFAAVTAPLVGNASTASALQTARDISLTGDVSGSVSFDGSANASITATIQPNSVALGTDTTGNYMSDLTQGTGVTITHTPGEGSNATIAIGQAVGTSSSVTFAHVSAPVTGNVTGNVTGSSGSTTGNAATATKLATSRTIELTGDVTGTVSFDGSANASISTTIGANSVALGTDTTGNYVNDITAGTGITVTHTPAEGSSPTIAIGQAVGTSSSVTFARVETTGNLVVGGDITVTGTLTTVNATNLAVEDTFIFLNDGSTITNPDLGVVGNYNDGTYRHAGIFRDATDGKFKFFDSYTPEPTHPIDTAHMTYSAAPVVAEVFESTIATGTAPLSVSSSTVVTNLNADKLDGQEGSYYLNTSSTLDGISNVSASAPVDYSPLVWSVSASAWVANSQDLTLGEPGTTNYAFISPIGYITNTAVDGNIQLTTEGLVTTTDSGTYLNLNPNNITFSNGTDNFIIDPYWGTSGQVLAFTHDGGFGSSGTWGPTTPTLDFLSDVSASAPSSGDFLKWNGTAWVNDAVDLGTDTTGSYVSSLVAGTGITITNNTGEGATPTIAIGQSVAASATPTFASVTGTGTPGLVASYSVGDEGGEILLSKPATNTTIAGTGVTIDIWQNRLRFFEQGGNARGAYIDLTACGNSAGTNLVDDVITNAQTASYTLVLADKGKLVEMLVGSANNLTVPLNSSVAFPIGTQINILQTGTGQTTVVATGGVTINATPGLKLRAQWSYATLIKRAENTWVLVGDISA